MISWKFEPTTDSQNFLTETAILAVSIGLTTLLKKPSRARTVVGQAPISSFGFLLVYQNNASRALFNFSFTVIKCIEKQSKQNR